MMGELKMMEDEEDGPDGVVFFWFYWEDSFGFFANFVGLELFVFLMMIYGDESG